jgi:hypothetical protein
MSMYVKKNLTSFQPFWPSMYFFTTSNDIAPTDDIKQLLVHRQGSLLLRLGNSFLNV